MTSWLSRTATLQSERTIRNVQQSKFFYQPRTDKTVATNFTHFFFAFAFAQKNGDRLHVLDRPENAPSSTFSLFADVFKNHPSVLYLTEAPASANNLGNDVSGTFLTLSKMSFIQIRRMAKDLFQWSSATTGIIQTILSRRVEKGRLNADIGIYLTKTTTPEEALEGLLFWKKQIGKEKPAVFVMSEDNKSVRDLARKPELAGWPLYSFSATAAAAHGDGESTFYRYLTELSVLQKTPYLVLPLNTDVGKFLYLTHAAEAIKPTDTLFAMANTSWQLA